MFLFAFCSIEKNINNIITNWQVTKITEHFFVKHFLLKGVDITENNLKTSIASFFLQSVRKYPPSCYTLIR